MSDPKEPKYITALLKQCEDGNKKAIDRLAEDVYPVLKRIAVGKLKKSGGRNTLNATTLVHEAFLKFFLERKIHPAKNRVHFYAMIAKAMQWFLLEYARAKGAQRRGGFPIHLTLNEALDGEEKPLVDILTLDTMLQELEKKNPYLYQIVQLKVFCGFTSDEIAKTLDVSVATVKRDWALAQAWFKKRLDAGEKAA